MIFLYSIYLFIYHVIGRNCSLVIFHTRLQHYDSRKIGKIQFQPVSLSVLTNPMIQTIGCTGPTDEYSVEFDRAPNPRKESFNITTKPMLLLPTETISPLK